MFNKKKQERIAIIGDQSNQELRDGKMLKSIITAICVVVLCGFIYGGYKILHKNGFSNQENQEFLAAKKAYEDAGIKNYTEEDFKKQKEQVNIAEVDKDGKVKAEEEKPKETKEDDEGKVDLGSGTKVDMEDYDPSKISEQINSSDSGITEKSDSQLALINFSEPEANITTQNIMSAILSDLNKYNESIKSNIGWPESEYDTRNFGASQKYIQDLIEYPRTGKAPRNIYPMSYEQQLGQVRYSIFHGIQLEMAEGSQEYNQILSSFLTNRAELNGIQSISVIYENTTYDSYTSRVKAIIISNGKSYVAHLSIDLTNENKLRLLDIE